MLSMTYICLMAGRITVENFSFCIYVSVCFFLSSDYYLPLWDMYIIFFSKYYSLRSKLKIQLRILTLWWCMVWSYLEDLHCIHHGNMVSHTNDNKHWLAFVTWKLSWTISESLGWMPSMCFLTVGLAEDKLVLSTATPNFYLLSFVHCCIHPGVTEALKHLICIYILLS